MPTHQLIPILTTPAGSSLTAQNWQEIGIQRVCCYLAALLVKPGIEHLRTLSDWSRYSGWGEVWVLNASMPVPAKAGIYTLRSPYDGTRVTFSMAFLVQMICHLKPQWVILPENLVFVDDDKDWQCLLAASRIFVPAGERARYASYPIEGLYYGGTRPADITSIQITHQSEAPELGCYISTQQSAEHLVVHADLERLFIESDGPAVDANMGVVYSAQGAIDLKDTIYATQFEPIDGHCQCPTCTQQFTRAYLHHLFEHTPLLCQRLLIQHNAFSNLRELHFPI
jgi:queuine tRNA-ribosyltransferase